MYVGAISGVIGSFFYERSAGSAAAMNPALAILIPMLCCLLGSMLMGLLYCFLTVTLRANQNVTGLAMTTFGVGFGNFFGGSLIKLVASDVPSIALSATSSYFSKSLPFAGKLGWFGKLFLSYGFLAYLAVIIAVAASYFLNHTRAGLHLRAVGEGPNTADAAGISVTRYKYLATIAGCMIAGLVVCIMSWIMPAAFGQTMPLVTEDGLLSLLLYSPYGVLTSAYLLPSCSVVFISCICIYRQEWIIWSIRNYIK